MTHYQEDALGVGGHTLWVTPLLQLVEFKKKKKKKRVISKSWFVLLSVVFVLKWDVLLLGKDYKELLEKDKTKKAGEEGRGCGKAMVVILYVSFSQLRRT